MVDQEVCLSAGQEVLGDAVTLFEQLHPHSTNCYKRGIVPELGTGDLKGKRVIVQLYGQTGCRKTDLGEDLTRVMLDDERLHKAATQQGLRLLVCTDNIVDYTIICRQLGLVKNKKGHLTQTEYAHVADISTEVRHIAYDELPGEAGNPLVVIQEDVGVTAVALRIGDEIEIVGTQRGDLRDVIKALDREDILSPCKKEVRIPVLLDADDAVRQAIFDYRREMRRAKTVEDAEAILKRRNVKYHGRIEDVMTSVHVFEGDGVVKRQHELGVARRAHEWLKEYQPDIYQRFPRFIDFLHRRQERLEVISSLFYPWWMDTMLLNNMRFRMNPQGQPTPRGYIFRIDQTPSKIESQRVETEARKIVSMLASPEVWSGKPYLRKTLQELTILGPDDFLLGKAA